MTFTIMITTHNRCADLRRTCAALTALSPAPDVVLIRADGGTGEPVSMINREFPEFVILGTMDRPRSAHDRTCEPYGERLVQALPA